MSERCSTFVHMFETWKSPGHDSISGGSACTMECTEVAEWAERRARGWGSALVSRLRGVHEDAWFKVEHASKLKEERDREVPLALLDPDDGGFADSSESSGLDLG